MSWQDKIRNKKCKLCDLHKSAQHVCLMGSGPKKAKVMIVGEAPGAREDEAHRAFVGPAGQLLNEMLELARLRREDVYITNVVKCRPPGNRTPERVEIRTCSGEYLEAEVRKVRPDYILALGNPALQALLRRSGITRHRGDLGRYQDSVVFPTFHPAYILRSPQFRGDLEADFERFGRMVRGVQQDQETRIRTVRTRAQLESAIRFLRKQRVLSYDIETHEDRGYRPAWADDAAIISIGFTWTAGQAIVIPLYHQESPFHDNWREVATYIAKKLLDNDGVIYVGHNGKYDSNYILSVCGVPARLTFDTMLAAHMLDENRLKGLKPLSQTLLGVGAYAEDTRRLYWKPWRRVAIYNGKDTDYAYQLFLIFREQLKKPENRRIARVFVKLMMPASDALVRVEARGMWWDRERHDERFEQVLKQQDKNYQTILKYTKNKRINLRAPNQVGRWLFGELKLPMLELTPRGAPSTAESVLLRLARLRRKGKPVRALLEYRKLDKQISAYFNSYPRHADYKDRIHCRYKLYGTVTGRLSSENPNLQQVPRTPFMRGLFGAPKGWMFVEADYSQIELRLIAWVAQDPVMRRIFLTGGDPHLTTAMELTGRPAKDVQPEERKRAKGVNFGYAYGMGERKFIEYARDSYGLDVTPEESHESRETYFRTYAALPAWHDRQRRLVRQDGFVTSPFGRVRHLPQVWSGDKGVRHEAERQAINSPIQSCGSDLMLLSLVRLETLLRPRDAFIVGTVHDAINFQVRNEALDYYLPIIRETMEDTSVARQKFGVEPDVPIEVEVKYGQHWGEGRVWDPERSAV